MTMCVHVLNLWFDNLSNFNEMLSTDNRLAINELHNTRTIIFN